MAKTMVPVPSYMTPSPDDSPFIIAHRAAVLEKQAILAARDACNTRTGRSLTIVHACAIWAVQGHKLEVWDTPTGQVVFNGTNDEILAWLNAQ